MERAISLAIRRSMRVAASNLPLGAAGRHLPQAGVRNGPAAPTLRSPYSSRCWSGQHAVNVGMIDLSRIGGPGTPAVLTVLDKVEGALLAEGLLRPLVLALDSRLQQFQ